MQFASVGARNAGDGHDTGERERAQDLAGAGDGLNQGSGLATLSNVKPDRCVGVGDPRQTLNIEPLARCVWAGYTAPPMTKTGGSSKGH